MSQKLGKIFAHKYNQCNEYFFLLIIITFSTFGVALKIGEAAFPHAIVILELGLFSINRLRIPVERIASPILEEVINKIFNLNFH